MKILSFILLISVVIFACKSQKGTWPIGTMSSTSSQQDEAIRDCGFSQNLEDTKGWNLIFEDNFINGLSNWNLWNSGAFNEELQYYQKQNVSISDGYLFIKAKREKARGITTPKNNLSKEFEFTSGRLESKNHFGPENSNGKTSVRFSARLRLAEGHGMWPAWWSYNDPWPTKGEIDFLEARGNTPYEFQSCFHYGTESSTVITNAKFNEFHYQHEEKLTDCFHIYELIWSKNKFQILFDGQLIKTYDEATYKFVDEFFGMKHKLVLNLAVGGWFFDDLDISQIPDKSLLVVDWVKVYQK